MWKKSILIVGFILCIPITFSFAQKNYTDCAKGDVQCEKEKAKGMADDRRRYEQWCKKHPGQCKNQMFK